MDITRQAYNAMLKNASNEPSDLPLERRLELEQVRQLRQIRARLDFFTLVLILYILGSFLFGSLS